MAQIASLARELYRPQVGQKKEKNDLQDTLSEEKDQVAGTCMHDHMYVKK